MPEPVVVAWSGGKDSALTLHELRRRGDVAVVGLLTTVAENDERVPLHGVPLALVESQAESASLRLHVVRVPSRPSNEVYEERMQRVLSEMRGEGITRIAHGDVHLEDVRAYRDTQLARAGMSGLYPLWTADPTESGAVMRRFVEAGFRAVVVCIESRRLSAERLGREFNAAFVRTLPEGVDPAGEFGEFHTFVYDGPVFAHPIAFTHGDEHVQDGFVTRYVEMPTG